MFWGAVDTVFFVTSSLHDKAVPFAGHLHGCVSERRPPPVATLYRRTFSLFSAHASPPLATSQQLPTLQHHLCTEIVGTQGRAASPWSFVGNQAGGFHWWPGTSCRFSATNHTYIGISIREDMSVNSGSSYEVQAHLIRLERAMGEIDYTACAP